MPSAYKKKKKPLGEIDRMLLKDIDKVLSEDALKIMHYNPDQLKNKQAAGSKRKQSTGGSGTSESAPSRRDSLGEDLEVIEPPVSDDEAPPSPDQRPPKRAKPSTDSAASNSDEEAEAEDNVTVYVVVVVPPARPAAPPPTTRGRKSIQPEKPAHHNRGAFFISTSATFEDFVQQIGERMNCQRASLVQVQELSWKFEKPMKGDTKPVTDKASFKALLKAVEERRKDRVIMLYTAPPAKNPDKEPWEEDDQPAYEEIAGKSSNITLFQEQKASIASAARSGIDELYEKYPVGNNPLFPGKRIYQDGNKYWEITDTRAQVWAVALNNPDKNCSLDKPPRSVHFEDNKCIIPDASGAHALQHPAPFAPGFAHNPFAQGAPPGGPPYPFPAPYHHPYMHAPPSYGYPTPAPYPPPGFSYHAAPPMPPPYSLNETYQALAPASRLGHVHAETVPLPWPITIQDFCQYQGLPESDQAKLATLEVRLGDRRCEALPESIWRGDGGFSKLGWDRFIEAHASFCHDVKRGVWNDGYPYGVPDEEYF